MYKTLEEEFAEYKEIHKYLIITSTLISFEHLGIYNNTLFRDKYSKMKEHGAKRADKVFDDILDRTENGEDNLLDDIYEYCWLKVRDKISDTRSYHLDNAD